MGRHGVTPGVHHSLTVSPAWSVTDLQTLLQQSISANYNLLISPPTLLLVLDGVHVVQHHGAVLVGPDDDSIKYEGLLVASNVITTPIVRQMAACSLSCLESEQTGNRAW